MKIFISHKQEDSGVAQEVLNVLRINKVDAYLDLLDNSIEAKGELLTNHVKKRLNECTDLLVVISEQTKKSWWVPFEIGMASQKDFPIVNYLKTGSALPEYLSYWPRLKNGTDLVTYIHTKIKVQKDIILEKSFGREKYATAESSTERFYRELKASL